MTDNCSQPMVSDGRETDDEITQLKNRFYEDDSSNNEDEEVEVKKKQP